MSLAEYDALEQAFRGVDFTQRSITTKTLPGRVYPKRYNESVSREAYAGSSSASSDSPSSSASSVSDEPLATPPHLTDLPTALPPTPPTLTSSDATPERQREPSPASPTTRFAPRKSELSYLPTPEPSPPATSEHFPAPEFLRLPKSARSLRPGASSRAESFRTAREWPSMPRIDFGAIPSPQSPGLNLMDERMSRVSKRSEEVLGEGIVLRRKRRYDGLARAQPESSYATGKEWLSPSKRVGMPAAGDAVPEDDEVRMELPAVHPPLLDYSAPDDASPKEDEMQRDLSPTMVPLPDTPALDDASPADDEARPEISPTQIPLPVTPDLEGASRTREEVPRKASPATIPLPEVPPVVQQPETAMSDLIRPQPVRLHSHYDTYEPLDLDKHVSYGSLSPDAEVEDVNDHEVPTSPSRNTISTEDVNNALYAEIQQANVKRHSTISNRSDSFFVGVLPDLREHKLKRSAGHSSLRHASGESGASRDSGPRLKHAQDRIGAHGVSHVSIPVPSLTLKHKRMRLERVSEVKSTISHEFASAPASPTLRHSRAQVTRIGSGHTDEARAPVSPSSRHTRARVGQVGPVEVPMRAIEVVAPAPLLLRHKRAHLGRVSDSSSSSQTDGASAPPSPTLRHRRAHVQDLRANGASAPGSPALQHPPMQSERVVSSGQTHDTSVPSSPTLRHKRAQLPSRSLEASPEIAPPTELRSVSLPVKLSEMTKMTQLALATTSADTPQHVLRRHDRALVHGINERFQSSERTVRRFSREAQLENNSHVRRTSLHLRHASADTVASGLGIQYSPRKGSDPRDPRFLYASTTPMSTSQMSENMEVCEARGMELFTHCNGSLLLVQQGGVGRAEGREVESPPVEDLLGKHAHSRLEEERIADSPPVGSMLGLTDQDMGVGSPLPQPQQARKTKRLSLSESIRTAIFPLPLPPPQLGPSVLVDSPSTHHALPAVAIIPPTPVSELDRQLELVDDEPPTNRPGLQRSQSLLQRARRYSSTILFGRATSLRRQEPRPESPRPSNLSPMWRPRGFWDDFDSDSEYDEYDLPHELIPNAPNPAAQNDKFSGKQGGFLTRSLSARLPSLTNRRDSGVARHGSLSSRGPATASAPTPLFVLPFSGGRRIQYVGFGGLRARRVERGGTGGTQMR